VVRRARLAAADREVAKTPLRAALHLDEIEGSPGVCVTGFRVAAFRAGKRYRHAVVHRGPAAHPVVDDNHVVVPRRLELGGEVAGGFPLCTERDHAVVGVETRLAFELRPVEIVVRLIKVVDGARDAPLREALGGARVDDRKRAVAAPARVDPVAELGGRYRLGHTDRSRSTIKSTAFGARGRGRWRPRRRRRRRDGDGGDSDGDGGDRRRRRRQRRGPRLFPLAALTRSLFRRAGGTFWYYG